MDAEDLDALPGQRHRDSDGRARAIGFFIAQDRADESFSRMSHQQRAPQLVKPAAPGNQRQVVLERLAEADARVQTNPLVLDARSGQCIAAPAEKCKELRLQEH